MGDIPECEEPFVAGADCDGIYNTSFALILNGDCQMVFVIIALHDCRTLYLVYRVASSLLALTEPWRSDGQRKEHS